MRSVVLVFLRDVRRHGTTGQGFEQHRMLTGLTVLLVDIMAGGD